VIESALVTTVNATLASGVSTIDTNGFGASWSGVLSGAGGLAKVGAGTLTLSGLNTYSGITNVTTGTLQAGAANTFSAASAFTVGAGTTLDLNGFSQTIGSLAGAGTVTNSGAGAAALTAGGDNTSTVFSGTLQNGTSALGLSKTGTGTLTVSGANVYSGATNVAAGTLQAGGVNAFSSASAFTVGAGAFLDLNGVNQTIGSLAGAGTVTNNGAGAATLTAGGHNTSTTFSGTLADGPGAAALAFIKSGTGALTLSGTNTYSGGTTLSAGTLAVGSNAGLGTGALTFANGTTLQAAANGLSLANGMTLNGSDTIDTQSNALALTGPIGGTGGLTKVGAGELELLGASSYAGATNVNSGTLVAGASNSFSAASAFTVGAGAFLDLGGFDQTIGSLAGAGTVQNGGPAAAALTTGGDNTSTTFSGVIQDCCSSLALTKVGTGTLTISGVNNTYTGATTVNGGTLAVTGDIHTSSGVTVNTGAILSGTGTVSNININNGGTLAPGLRFAPGTLTAIGSLVMQAAATYLVQVSPTAQSVAAFTGTASLNGTLALNAAPGSYTFGTRYAVLTAAGGVNGTFANTTAGSGPVTATVSYDANDVYLTFSQAFITAPVRAAGNAKGVANALNAYITDPPLPPAFQNLFNLSPAQLAEALAQLSGENNAGGGQQASFQMMNEFLLLMLNPFDTDRGGFGGAGFGAGDGVSRFAPHRERALPPEIARAYAAVTPPSERATPFSSRWNVWASAFGGTNNTNGDPNGTGSHNFNARTGGVAAGVDYKLTPDTLIGFALAGGGTSWGLSQNLGSGSTDAFQAGLYGSQRVRVGCGGVRQLLGLNHPHDHAAGGRYPQRRLQRPELGRPRRGRLSDRVGAGERCTLCGTAGAKLLDPELHGDRDLRLQCVRLVLRIARRKRGALRTGQLALQQLSRRREHVGDCVRSCCMGARLGGDPASNRDIRRACADCELHRQWWETRCRSRGHDRRR
jgi:autotransporter-associated beta strand protein